MSWVKAMHKSLQKRLRKLERRSLSSEQFIQAMKTFNETGKMPENEVLRNYVSSVFSFIRQAKAVGMSLDPAVLAKLMILERSHT